MNAELAKVREAIVTGNITQEAHELCEKYYSMPEIDAALQAERQRLRKLEELWQTRARAKKLEVGLLFDEAADALDTITRAVEAEFGMHENELNTRGRTQRIALPRQVVFYLARLLTETSFTEIGKAFKNRDHGTVLHGQRSVRDRMETDPAFRLRMQALIKKCETLLLSAKRIGRDATEENGKKTEVK